jgi:hypothetical protein
MVGDEEEQEARGAARGFGQREPVALRHLVGGHSSHKCCSNVCHDQGASFCGLLSVNDIDDPIILNMLFERCVLFKDISGSPKTPKEQHSLACLPAI